MASNHLNEAEPTDVLVLQGKSEGSLTSSSFYSVVNCTESEDFVELVDAKDISKSPIEGACLEDVIIEEGNDFLIRKTRGDQEPEHSSLKEIKGISIQDIKVGALRAFCVKVGLRGQGRATKQEIVHKLVEFKSTPQNVNIEKSTARAKIL